MDGVARMLGLVPQAVRDVTRLVLPVECPGCGELDVLVCPACAAVLSAPVRRCEPDVPRLDRMDGRPALPVWTVARYAGPTRGLVVGWKDHGRADLTRLLAATARRAGREIAPVLGAVVGTSEVLVTGIPSSPGARRRRGADLVRLLASAAATGLVDGGLSARAVPVLVRRRGDRDQVGLGARARGRNTAGSLRLRTSSAGHGAPLRGPAPAGRWCLIVDDVVTTGSTLAAADGVLSGSGALVLGALVIAATPPPSFTRGPLLASAPED
ncbi:ComF family protein [Cellulomonas sp. KRMCY2]|uniref:ComF family protein n=1 Tax=Cellulomonas sp. KRMCY2 TaxID=1304865 RepID=UPI00045E9F89|nr:hypothetical protein [Cellulomonas sp. KRMCY2]